jgi:hypothetical protein
MIVGCMVVGCMTHNVLIIRPQSCNQHTTATFGSFCCGGCRDFMCKSFYLLAIHGRTTYNHTTATGQAMAPK